MSVNKVILVGHVGQDPEVRYLDSNTPVCTLRMATSDVYKNKSGERVTTTEWHSVVLWRGLAEVAEKYVKKGSQIYIEGKLRTRSWDDKDKNKRYTTEIIADVLQLLGKRADDQVSPGNQAPQVGHADVKPEIEEPDIANDLPF
jgi:single-strand DNA-binding protein